MNPANGVFETLLARDGRVQALELHLERLATAIEELYKQRFPRDLEGRVRGRAAGLEQPHRLRIDATPRPDGLDIAIAATRVPTGPPPHTPVRLKPAVVRGGIGPYKWRDRRLIEGLSDERTTPLILDTTDEVLEAGAMNVWILEDRRIVTPPADGRLLPGVTRTLLLGLAPALGLIPATEPITLARARTAAAIFVTSSIRHAVPAILSDGTGHRPDGAAAAAVQDIRSALDAAAWA